MRAAALLHFSPHRRRENCMSDNFELPPGYSAEVFLTPAASRLRVQADAKLDLTLFVSCYNEQDLVVETLERARTALRELGTLSFELVIVDDCSTDQSATVLKEYLAQHPDDYLVLRCNRKNRGLSQNYIDSAFLGVGAYYRLVCGDTPESVDTMKIIYAAVGDADMILPYYPQAVANKSFPRRLVSATYRTIINVLTGQKIHYYNGLAVHRRFHVMRWHPTTRGFGFPADIICMLIEQGYSYKEIPVAVTERKPLASTAVTWANFLSLTHTATNIIIRRLSKRVHEAKARNKYSKQNDLPIG
jgi:glycosyltransferase involved in cell wall biosynthesis